jgi:ribosomal protein S18 acetylase RimI-like enzyme
MNSIEYKKLEINEDQIMNLYKEDNWVEYVKNKTQLFKGLGNSLDSFGAYENNQLVGLVRTIGDGATIVYIQDVLTLSTHRRQGIGSKLIRIILDKYKDVRQIVLMTDNDESKRLFYESLGFQDLEKYKTLGFLILN